MRYFQAGSPIILGLWRGFSWGSVFRDWPHFRDNAAESSLRNIVKWKRNCHCNGITRGMPDGRWIWRFIAFYLLFSDDRIVSEDYNLLHLSVNNFLIEFGNINLTDRLIQTY